MSSGIKHSLLTEKDREFLRGELEYHGENARQTRYGRRKGIQERVERGIEDLALLADQPGRVSTRLDDIEEEDWDTALEAVRVLHPDPPDQLDADELRSIAEDLTKRADRIENID